MADLNSTIVRGKLRVTDEISGPINITNLSTGANGKFLSIENGIPAWVNNPNTTVSVKVNGSTYNSNSGLITLPDFLRLSTGGTVSGTITLPENSTSLKFRTPSDYETGTFYGTSGNEALTFYAKSAQTSFQFISGFVPGSTDSWKTIAPGLQIKNNKVIINKKLGDGESSNYNLEVNGSMYATDITTNGTLDLSSTFSKIKFATSKQGVSYFITNIEVGSNDVTLAGTNGTEAYVDVTYKNGSKGGGTLYIVATAHGSNSDNVSVGISYESDTGFRLWVRNVYKASSRTLTIHWIAIKYW